MNWGQVLKVSRAPDRRSDDPKEPRQWQRLVAMRRVRETDNGDYSGSLQAQRCMMQVRTIAWRAAATMIGTATVVIAAGVFAWGSNEHEQLRVTSAMSTHAHMNNALTRELETLRTGVMRQLSRMHAKLDQLQKQSERRRSSVPAGGPAP